MSLKTERLQIITQAFGHQGLAVEKFSSLRVGALFMDMGTGKTRTALEICVKKILSGRARHLIWIAPVSTLGNLADDILKHMPRALVYRFCDKTRAENLPRADIYLVGTESLSASLRVFHAVESIAEKSCLVVDESHMIKNAKAIRTKRAFALGRLAAYRFILTGTEITQGIEDLYGQISFLSDKIFGYSRFREFEHHHLEYWDGYPRRVRNRYNEDVLVAKMAPYVYRVSKEECLDLPPKSFQRRWVDLTAEQREYYERVKEDALYSQHAFQWGDCTIYKLFSGLQRVVSGYYRSKEGLVSIFENEMSPRQAELKNLLEGLNAERKVIIWCKFTVEVEDAKQIAIQRHGKDAVAEFWGGLSIGQREEEIRRFKSSSGRVLVANLGAGGLGLNLTESSYAIYYANVFKMSQRLQSEDRCHRIGQENPVTYVDITCSNTIDEIIMKCQESRMSCIEQFKEKLKKIKQVKNKKEAQKLLKKEVAKL